MKYIITGVLPSGKKVYWAVPPAGAPRCFTLGFVEGGEVRNAVAFDSVPEAEAHIAAQLRVGPDLEKLGPFAVEAVELPS